MHSPPLPVIIDADPPIPFTDEEIGSAAHEKHMPSVRAIAVDPDRGLVLLNLVGADASVSAVIMELLRSKSNGVGFMSTLFARQPTNIPTQLSTPIPAAGVTCWRIDGDLIKWVDLVKHGIQSKRFVIPVQTDLPQQRAA